MKKRLLSALLCLCMVVCMMPTVSLAAETASGSCGDNVTWSLSDDGTLTISGTGDMENYDRQSEYAPWYANKNLVKKVVLEGKITSIGDCAFYKCSALMEVVIPDSVTKIGSYTFGYCSSLTSIILPESITDIDYAAFSHCSNLTDITIPSGVTKILIGTFSYCSSLESITIPENVGYIGLNAFAYCSKLSDVVVENKDISVMDEAFVDTPWLDNYPGMLILGNKLLIYHGTDTKVTIPNNVTKIESKAFSNCTMLTDIEFSENLDYIGSSAFLGCINLTTVNIPENVTQINRNTFSNCTALTNVKLPRKMNNIGESAFLGCTSLKWLAIPSRAINIGDYAFGFSKDKGGNYTLVEGFTAEVTKNTKSEEYCKNNNILYEYGNELTWWVSEDGTLNITGKDQMDDYYYYNGPWSSYRQNIKKIVIGDGIENIGKFAFAGFSNLTEVTIPDTVQSIGEYAFYDCESLKSVKIPDGITEIKDGTFCECSNLTEIIIPDSVINIGDNTFNSCRNLNMTMPSNLISIGDGAFSNCSNLNITMPSSLASIGNGAFYNCSSLDITIPDSVTSIGARAFENTSYYKDEANWKDGILYYDNWLLSATPDMKTANIAKGVKYIADSAFSGCNLRNVTIPDGVTMIGNSAFAIEYLSRLTIPASVVEIGAYAFGMDVGGSAKRGFIATVTEGSVAEAYCEKNKIKYEYPPSVNFTDIDATQYYATPVQWAVAKEITNGMGDNKFEPNTTCTRGQIVTFLWRANGKPEPTSTNNPFTDVNINEYYGKAVLWAVEKGITTGTSDTTFSPNMGCTRGQVATFLWRANGKPSSSTGNPFSDVNTSEYYGTAVLWAVEKGVTNGMGDGTFAPNTTCTRGQIVTFLYRDMA